MTKDVGSPQSEHAEGVPSPSPLEYRLLLESSADVVFQTVEGKLRWISPVITALAGWRPEDVVGVSTIEFWHPDDREAAAVLRKRAAAGEPGMGVFRLRTRDGDYVWVELSLRPYRSEDGRAGVAGALRDVGERIAAEQALAASEERYRLLADNVTDVLWVMDLQTGFYTYISPSVERLSGYTQAEVLSMPVEQRLTPESAQRAMGAIASAAARGETDAAAVIEVGLLHKSGHAVPAEISARFLPSADGQPHQLLGVTRDITARRAAEQALRARTDELDALLDASRAIVSSLDYDRVLQEVARSAGQALGSPECVVWEYSPRGDLALFRSLWEREPVPGVAGSLVGSSYGITSHTGGLESLRAGTVIQETRSDPGLSRENCDYMDMWGEKTWLTVPLVSERGLLGVMVLVETERERTFTADEVRLAAAVGEQAAVALDNARLHRQQEERNRWLDALVEAGRQVASELDMGALVENVARLAAESVGAPVACMYEYDAERDALITRSRHGAATAGRLEPLGSVVPVADTPGARRALAAGEVWVETLSDRSLPDDVRGRLEASGAWTQVNVPFRFAGEALGLLVLIETEAGRIFSVDELAYLRAFGELAAAAFNNARLYATIEAQAARDGLTGLANHRTFHERLEQEVARARRYGGPVSLLLLDVDDFKAVNDGCGHQAGDEVLRLLAGVIAAEVRRDVDVPARYGGEEFAVIMPNTDIADCATADRPAPLGQRVCEEDEVPRNQAGAEIVAERIRARVEGTRFVCGANGHTLGLTVSIGVAGYPLMATDARGLLAGADAALYAAKRAGKNAVSVGGPLH